VGWWDGAPSSAYGADAGWFGNFHDFEKGNVYSMSDGTPLALPANATYNPAYSTQYSAVYDTADGHAMSFMHIKNLLYGTTKPTPEAAGFQFAVDSHMPSGQWYTGTTADGKRSLPMVEVDAPGTAVVEFGMFDTAAHAFARNSGGDIAPSSWPSIFSAANRLPAPATGGVTRRNTPEPVAPGGGAGGEAGWGNTGNGSSGGWTPPAAAPPVADWSNPFANGAGSIFDWGKGTPFDSSQQPGGQAGSAAGSAVAAAAQGPGQLLAGAGAMGARLGLVGLFGGAALVVLILTVKPYISL